MWSEMEWSSSCKDTVYIYFFPLYLLMNTSRGSSPMPVWRHHQFHELWMSGCHDIVFVTSSGAVLSVSFQGKQGHHSMAEVNRKPIPIKLKPVGSKDHGGLRAITSQKCWQGFIPAQHHYMWVCYWHSGLNTSTKLEHLQVPIWTSKECLHENQLKLIWLP